MKVVSYIMSVTDGPLGYDKKAGLVKLEEKGPRFKGHRVCHEPHPLFNPEEKGTKISHGGYFVCPHTNKETSVMFTDGTCPHCRWEEK